MSIKSMNTVEFGAGATGVPSLQFSSASAGAATAVLPPRPIGRAFDMRTNQAVEMVFDLFPRASPDPAFQWHLGYLGDIGEIWKDYRGAGVSVGVYDSGTESAHWDLAANYDASKELVVDGKRVLGDIDYAVPGQTGAHGTSAAGLIAAAANGRGGVGVAYESTVTGVNMFSPKSVITNNDEAFFKAIAMSANFDITNNSWGFTTFGETQYSRSTPGSIGHSLERAWGYAADNGRGGLGTIVVHSAGNTPVDGGVSEKNGIRSIITVAAYADDGAASFYTTRGAGLLVSAPSSGSTELGQAGQTTTDPTGAYGYNMTFDPAAASDYTDGFGGTSGAAPVVVGVAALMLDANPGLGWRDVKNILAASAKMPFAFETGPVAMVVNDKGDGSLLNQRFFELTGRDAGWNGGAMHFSNDYGYGAVDAYNAVRMAEVWSLFGQAQTSRNEVSATTGRLAVDMTSVGADSPRQDEVGATNFYGDFVGKVQSFSFDVTDDVDLEHIDLVVDFTTTRTPVVVGSGFVGPTADVPLGLEQMKLIAPDGSSAFFASTLLTLGTVSGAQTFKFGFTNLRGVDTKGTWTFEFSQLDARVDLVQLVDLRMKNTIHNIEMQMFGGKASADDVYTYTGEFFTMAAIAGEDGRTLLSDTDGGTDWINAAAIAQDVSLSLSSGGRTTFDGRTAFTIAAGSAIENAVTGDGNDRLIGNALDNRLYGMRGDDWLNGGAGNDWLSGAWGRDVFAFDTAGISGNDRVLDWGVGDRIATSKQLRGADMTGLVTLGANAMVLLDGTVRGDTAELAGMGGAKLQALGRSDGYWWYGFVSDGSETADPTHVLEQSAPLRSSLAASFIGMGEAAPVGAVAAPDIGFYLYETMGDAMVSGVQLYA